VPGFDVIRHNQCAEGGAGAREFRTLLIDLTADRDALMAGFKKSTAYEIRRCEQSDGLAFAIDPAPAAAAVDAFIAFFRAFMVDKGWPDAGDKATFYGDLLHQYRAAGALTISAVAGADGRVLYRHTYINDGRRARLVNSASIPRSETPPAAQAMMGRANRCLHWRDMLHFKDAGHTLYDFGGISTDGADSISRFKLSFGGRQVVEYYDFYRAFSLRGRLALALRGWRTRRGEPLPSPAQEPAAGEESAPADQASGGAAGP